MEKAENIGVCTICGTAFKKKRSDMKYCSRRCAKISANRAIRARERGVILECGTDCTYNGALICKEHKCDTCGWNPEVARRRLTML